MVGSGQYSPCWQQLGLYQEILTIQRWTLVCLPPWSEPTLLHLAINCELAPLLMFLIPTLSEQIGLKTKVKYIFVSKFLFMCRNVLPTCMYMHYMCAWCPQRSKQGVGFPWNRRYRWFRAIMWALETKPRSLSKATSILNHWAISPALTCKDYLNIKYQVS